MMITGAMLRQAREDSGMSLSAMARMIFLDKGYLSRIETRRGAVPEHVVKQYEQILGVDLNRRELLTGLAAGAVVPGTIADALRQGIDQVSLSVDGWMAKLDSYAVDAMTTGPSEMQLRLASDLVLLQRQLTEPRMWGIAARMMVLHGAPLVSITDGVAVQRWYRSAATAARRSCDVSTQTWVLGRAALSMAHPSTPLGMCSEFATAAVELETKASVGKLMAIVSLANVEALHGRAAGAVAALEDAKRVFDVVGSADGHDSELTMPEWRMNLDESLVLSRLGDPKADRAYDQAVGTIPVVFSRYATHLDLHRGLALTKVGDQVGGISYARQALNRLPADRHSVALRRLYTEIAS